MDRRMRIARTPYAIRCLAPALLSAAVGGCGRSGAQATPERPVAAAVDLGPARSARFVKLEEVSEWSGKPWAAMAEFNLLDSTGHVVDRHGWVASADSVAKSDAASNALDGEPKSHWHTRWEGPDPAPPPPHWFVVKLDRPVKVSGFRYLPRQDGTSNGTIADYRFFISDDGVNWGAPVASGNFTAMGGPTQEKTVIFARQTENHLPVVDAVEAQRSVMGAIVSLQFKASDEDGDALSYSAVGLPLGLVIGPKSGLVTGTPIEPGTSPVKVSVGDGKGQPVTVAFEWRVDAPTIEGAVAASGGEARFVKLEADTEVNGKSFASVAELNILGPNGENLPRNGWTASADSADVSDTPANAIDGLPGTHWHSQWNGLTPPLPHMLIVDMKRPVRVTGFRYLPRQDGSTNGTIARFRFFVSSDGVNWGRPAAEGDFAAMHSGSAEKMVRIQ